jgi:hypothetical protein
MPRSGRLRRFIKEYKESDRIEKLSFIPPIFILIVELILLLHALSLNHPDMMVVELTTVLLIISIIEMILVSSEAHDRYTKSNFDKVLTIRLDDFITKRRERNVKNIVTDFIGRYPDYSANRNEIYHTTCQILQTHKEEAIEKEITDKLKTFIKRKKRLNVDDVVESFVKKNPKYKKYRIEIYEKTCQLMGTNQKK